jgi:hypothetical protein
VTGTPVVPVQATGTAVDVGAPQGPVQPDIQETEIAASQAKPSILYFYWPNPEDPAGDACKLLDTKLWIDGQVCDLAQKFVCIKVDGKKCPPQVLRQFDVKSFPTIVFGICNKKIVSRVRSSCVEPKAFAKAMQSVIKTNEKVAKMLEAKNAKLDQMVEAAGKLLDSGRLDSAEKAFRKLLKDAPESDQAGAAHAGLAEIGCRRDLDKGQDFFKKEKYAEARSFLQMASECEVPCTARDEARDLLPDCEFGLLYNEACQKLAAGENLAALEAFTKIAGDTCYEGQFKTQAAAKLKEMKDAWNSKSN